MDKLNGKNILWVEDDKFLSDIIIKKLSLHSATLAHFSSGEEALKYLETNTTDVIVLDVLLPGMDGYDLLKKIKLIPKVASVPVVMLSNLSERTDVDKAKKAGAVLFLVKAAETIDEVLSQIEKILK